MTLPKFWSFDGDTWEMHETAAEAHGRCVKALQEEGKIASDDGWRDEVASIMWGPIAVRVVQTYAGLHSPNCANKESPTTEDCSCGSDGYEDYELQPTKVD